MSEWESSRVMSEFLKVASESGLINSDLKQDEGVGNPTKDTPVITRNEPDENYGVKTEPKNIIDKAHPQEAWMAQDSTPVNSMGDGSLVENIKEQQEKDIEIATKMPHGALIGVHAELVSKLVKLANSLEDEGKIKEAALVDKTIKKISTYPFDKGHLRKESGWFLIPLIGGSIGAAVKLFGHMLTSKQENLSIDLKDLYDKLIDKSDRSKSSAAAAKLIQPFLSKIDEVDISTKEGSDAYAKVVRKLGPVLKNVGTLVMAAKQDIKGPSAWYSKVWTGVKGLFGFEDYKIIAEKFKDCLASYKEAQRYTSRAKKMENKLLPTIGRESSVYRFMGEKYDDLEALEVDLNAALKKLYDLGKIKKPLSVDIVRDGKPTTTPQKIREVLEIVEKKLGS